MQNVKIGSQRAFAAPSPDDPRWSALNAVRDARECLGLKDRTIAVLRGMLTLVPPESWAGTPMIHAANTTLQQRCDGMDERTLRRHLAILVKLGLISRRQSPNRKRYVVRDETGAALLTYGFDLTPLREAFPRLLALADAQRVELVKIQALKAVLRDCLYRLEQKSPDFPEQELLEYRRLLRRNCSAASLENIVAILKPQLAEVEDDPLETSVLTDSVGQNDRDIQSSKKEHIELKHPAPTRKSHSPQAADELSITFCSERIPNALEFASKRPETWLELTELADQLGPSLGISLNVLQKAQNMLGHKGRVLAVLGLVQAYPQIRRPDCYLNTLLTKAKSGILNIPMMFRSLTSDRRHRQFPAGNHP